MEMHPSYYIGSRIGYGKESRLVARSELISLPFYEPKTVITAITIIMIIFRVEEKNAYFSSSSVVFFPLYGT